jgi:hypothetical protein
MLAGLKCWSRYWRRYLARKNPETKFYESIKDLLNNIPNSVWFRINQISIRGTPDIMGCVSGTCVAIELKRSEEYLNKCLKGVDDRTKLQNYNINKINNKGGYATFCYPENWAEVYATLLAISENRWNNH